MPKLGLKFPIMGRQGVIGDRFRAQLRHQRERLGWSQQQVADALAKQYKLDMYSTTIAKIEAGERSVRIDELYAFADLLNMSADVLLGRRGSGVDALAAASRLTSAAHRIATEVDGLQRRLAAEYEDLRDSADRDQQIGSVQKLIDKSHTAIVDLRRAHAALMALAEEFPISGTGRK